MQPCTTEPATSSRPSAPSRSCLGDFRPAWFRPELGWGGENIAHRIAVEWDDETGTHSGVYIPYRHSDSWLPVAAGARVFPGIHHHCRFDVIETDDSFRVAMTSPTASVSAHVAIAAEWSSTLFPTVDDASRFFELGAVGWSPDRKGRRLDGLRLATDAWKVDGARAVEVRSSFFDSLPAGSARLDCVLVMRRVPIVWSVVPDRIVRAVPAAAA